MKPLRLASPGILVSFSLFLSSPIFSQGNALLFDDVDDSISFVSGPDFDGTGDMTFEAWINPSTVTGFQYIASWLDGTGQLASFYLNNGFLEIYEDDGFAQSGNVTGTIPILANEWTHVAFVQSSGAFDFYVNGVQEIVGSPAGTAGFLDMFKLGTSEVGSSNFGGLMDEVRVWNFARSPAQVQATVYNALVGNESGLIAYYDFNQSSGTVLPDLTTSGFDGTLNNFTLPAAWQESGALTEVFTVTDVTDAGPGSLRNTITSANGSIADNVRIEFDIAGGGPWVIQPTSSLPTIDNTGDAKYIIEGTSQPGWVFGDTTTMVIIDGVSAGSSDGLVISETDVWIYGLVVQRFTGDGIRVNAGSDRVIIGGPGSGNVINANTQRGIYVLGAPDGFIQGNYIGTSIDGLSGNGNLNDGIFITNSVNFWVGGDRTVGFGNVISGNGNATTEFGIEIQSSDIVNVFGNLIGTDKNGTNAVGNNGGIRLATGATNTDIGGQQTGRLNVISGNSSWGIEIRLDADGTLIDNNIIGLDLSGSVAVPNGDNGIEIVATGTAYSIINNTISANNVSGILIDGVTASIDLNDNLIGTDSTGTVGGGLANLGHGVAFSDASGVNNSGLEIVMSGNVISGNGNANVDNAVYFQGAGTNFVVQSNFIGVEGDGSTALGNSGTAIFIQDGYSEIIIGGSGVENIIAHSQGASATSGFGIYFDDDTDNDDVYASNVNVQQNEFLCNANLAIGYKNNLPLEPPEITAITTSAIGGTSSALDGAIVYVFEATDACNNDQGANFLGETTVTGGNWSFGGSFTITDNFSAFVNDPGTGVSPFSSGLLVNSNADNGPGTLRDAITRANMMNTSAFISFDISPNTITFTSALPVITSTMILDGTTLPGWDIDADNVVTLDGSGLSGGEEGIDINASDVEIYGFKVTGFPGTGINARTFTTGVIIGAVGKGNVSNNNGGRGIALAWGGTVVSGNRIGTNAAGTAAAPNATGGISLGNNTVVTDNLISGHNGSGDEAIFSNGIGGHLIANNKIGTDITGTFAIPNHNGIEIVTGGSSIVDNNVISGNSNAGIWSNTGFNDNDIINNIIGLNATATDTIPNGTGILFAGGTGNRIGFKDNPNIIAGNIGAAIETTAASTENTFVTNSIYENGAGIVLAAGANGDIAPPAIDSVAQDLTTGTGPEGSTIHLYVSDNNGQGQTFLDSTSVSGGTWTITGLSLKNGDKLVATSTDYGAGAGTSEFSEEILLYPQPIPPGSALGFNGVSEYVQVPDDPALDFDTDDFTVEYWVRKNATASGFTNTYGVSKWNNQGGNPGGNEWALNIGSNANDDIPKFSIEVGTTSYGATSSETLQLGEWYHLAGVKKGSELRIYVNGALTGTQTGVPLTINNVGRDLNIARNDLDTLFFSDADFDELRIWRAAVDRTTLLDWIDKPVDENHPDFPTLEAYYRFDDSDGTFHQPALADIAGTNDGTLNDFLADNSASWIASGALDDSVVVDNALHFDGVDDLVQLNSSTFTAYTIEAWVRLDGSISLQSVIRFTDGSTQTSHHIVTDSTGHFQHYTFDGVAKAVTGNTVAIPGQWYHIAIVAQNSGMARLYVNGVEEGTPVALGTLYNSGNQFRIGETSTIFGSTVTNYLNGAVDEIRIWNTERTQTEIQDNLYNELNGDEAGLAAYYDFNVGVPSGDNTGTVTLPDRTANGINGTLTNFDLSGGPVSNWISSEAAEVPNNALDFDGVDDIVDMGDVTILDAVTDLTVEAWIYPRSYAVNGTNIRGVVAKSFNSGPSTSTFHGYFSDTGFHYGLHLSGGVATSAISASTYFPLNEWTHYAMTWSSGNNLKIYVDGVLVRDDPFAFTGPPVNLTQPLRIGSTSSVVDDGFDGQIDEVRIWGIERTQNEIQSDIHQTLIGNELGLLAYYPFNQGVAGGNNASETTLLDFTSNGIDGSLTGFALTGPTSNWVTSGSQDNIPNEPSDLFTTEVSPTQIDLSWTDNAFNETGYTIERSDGNNTSFVFLDSAPADATNYLDNSVTADNGYFYRVIANGVAGDSNPSLEKFGSTIVAPGNALDYDGNDDEIVVTDHPDLNFGTTQDFTLEAWVKTSSSRLVQSIFDKRVDGGSFTGYHLYLNNGVPNIQVNDGAINDFTMTGAINDGSWHHIAAVFDRSANVAVFVDGISAGTADISGVGDIDNSEPLRIGGHTTDVSTNGMLGEIDEVRVWDQTRSQAEIQSFLSIPLIGNESGLLAYYRFDQDETTDLILPDRSTNNNNGAWLGNGGGVTTAQWVSSGALDGSVLVNNALDFDGVDDHIDLGNVMDNVFAGADKTFSIEAWVYPTASNPAGIVLSKQGNSNCASDERQISFSVLDDNKLTFSFYGTLTLSQFRSYEGSTSLNANQWYHVAITYDGSIDTGDGIDRVKLYVDGVEETVNTRNIGGAFPFDIVSGPARTAIGGNLNSAGTLCNGANQAFSGIIDELRVWSSVRTQAEIQANMFSGIAGGDPNLSAYYMFDQGDAGGTNTGLTTLSDITTNAYDGTLVNFALSGASSNWVTSGGFDETPNDPTGLFTTEVSGTQIDLSWTDNAFNETGYTVERSDGNNDFTVPDATFPLGPDVTSYNDASVTGGNGYFYRVIANGASGDSNPSIEKFASTYVQPASAIDLDGFDDYFIVQDHPSLDITGDLTISAWIRPEQFDGAFRGIVGKFDTNPQESYYFGIQNDQLVTNLSNDGSTDDTDLSDPGVLTVGVWQHVAFTYNATSDVISYYVDGIAAGTGSHTGGIFASTANLFIGWQTNGNNSTFDGDLDEIRIWDKERTQIEIQSDLGLPLMGNEPNLIAYYKFDQDESTDSFLPDRSTNNNNGAWLGSGGGVTTPQWVSSGALIQGGVISSDYNALVALYNSTDGANWTNNTNWLSASDVDTWYGITTSGSRVYYINLGANNLNGTIPPELGDLTNLDRLQIFENQLTGSIPPELGNLINLDVLHLYRNQLSGSIPVELENLSNIWNFDLFENQLTGSIPPELGNLVTMGTLQLQENLLTGTIPSELGNLTSLVEIELGDNQLTGSIPPELGNLVNVSNFELEDNLLTGTIPSELGDITALRYLELDNNQLSGTIPPELGNLSNLEELSLYQNQLTGSIPTEIGSLTNLTGLWLDENQLTGTIPTQMGNLTNLVYLELNNNMLIGSIPIELGSLTNLLELRLEQNQLSGTIPTELGNLVNLLSLRLGENLLTGVIPSGIGNLVNLTLLELDRNQLTGSIPVELGNLVNLNSLELHVNMLTGPIPVELGNLTNLQGLQLDRNQLTGTIPTDLGNLLTLQYLDLWDNQLSGPIPTELGNLVNLIDFELDQNQLTGTIPLELFNLVNVLDFDIHSNLLTGPIPTQVENFTMLEVLELSNNQLSGTIPIEIGSLSNLVELDLSENLLGGPIPTELGNLSLMADMELDDNQLTGSIPSELSSLTLLTDLQLNRNQLTDSVPALFTNLTNLMNFEIDENQLSFLPDLSSLSGLSVFRISDNNFHFDDIEPNAGITGIVYSPQNPIITSDTIINEGDELNITLSIGGSANQYQWVKDGIDIPGQTTDNLLIANVTPLDSGAYLLEVTSLIVPGLTVTSDTFNVSINASMSVPDVTLMTLDIVDSVVTQGDQDVLIYGYSVSVDNAAAIEQGFYVAFEDSLKADLFVDSTFNLYLNTTLEDFGTATQIATGIDFGDGGNFPTKGVGFLRTDTIPDGDTWYYFITADIEPTASTDSNFQIVTPVVEQFGYQDPKNKIDGGLKAGSLFTITSADTLSPIITVDSLSTNDTSPPLTGTVDDTAATIDVAVDGNNYAATNNGDGTWTLPGGIISPILIDGTYDVSVTATDSVGNEGTDATTDELFIDATTPTVTVDALATEDTRPELTGTVDDNSATIDIEVDGSNYAATNNADGTWTLADNAISPALAVGTYEVIATATDALGNAGTDGTNNELEILVPAIGLQNDSTMLTTIYAENGGDQWPKQENWLDGAIETWEGVTVSDSRVTSVDLSANNVRGTINITTGLDALITLDLVNNEVTDMTGEGQLSALTTLNVSSNRLTFDVIDRLVAAGFTVDYTNQKPVLMQTRTLKQLGESHTLNRTVPGGETYNWFKDSVATTGSGPTLEITDIDFTDRGDYHAVVTSSLVPDLTLTTRFAKLRVSSLEADSLALMAIRENISDKSVLSANWENDLMSTWQEISIADNPKRVVGIDLSNTGITGELLEDILDMGGLEIANFSDNAITQIPELTTLDSLQGFDVSGNKLDFGSIEPNVDVPGIDFSDQDSLGSYRLNLIPGGSDETVSLLTTGTALNYQWIFRPDSLGDGNEGYLTVGGATKSIYRINDIAYSTMGRYVVEVSSDVVDDGNFKLYSRAREILAFGGIEFFPGFEFSDGTRGLIDQGEGKLFGIVPSGPYKGIDTVDVINESIVFDSVILGDYILNVRTEPDYRIIQPLGDGTTDTVQFIPTYFTSVIDWLDADTLRLRDFLSDTLSIQRIPPPLEPDEGEGTLALLVESDFPEDEASGRVEARRRVKKAGCSLRRRRTTGGGRPAQNDEEFELIAYKETDDNGEVNFGFLPNGTYRLNIQYPGVPMDPNSFVEFEIGDLNTGFEVEATVTTEGIFVERLLSIRGSLFKDLNIYPNPAIDQITLSYRKLRHNAVELIMTDLQGREMMRKRLEKGSNQEIRLDVDDLTNGIYLLNFWDVKRRHKKQLATYKIIIQR